MNEQKQKDDETNIKSRCDRVICTSAQMMYEDFGASIEMIIDRMLTYGLSQSASVAGAKYTAEMLRQVADQIDAGLLDGVARKEGSNH